ncbi:MAG: DUF6275 family protein [Eubacterium sp.]
MDEQTFIKLAKRSVKEYVNANLDITDGKRVSEKDIYIVWQCKTLQNNKALLSTTLPDGMYYECTFNGDKNEMYVDAYKKWENFVVHID